MSEIEKMYENAGIRKIGNRKCTTVEYLDCMEKCASCDKYAISYPPFTAEKQIKIIEWLDNSKAFFDENETIFSLITNHKDKNGVVRGYKGKGNSVDSCLAGLINSLWKDLTEEERKQIKEILK